MPSKVEAIQADILEYLSKKMPFVRTASGYDRRLLDISENDRLALPALLLAIEKVSPSRNKGIFEFEFLIDCLVSSESEQGDSLALDFGLRVFSELQNFNCESSLKKPQNMELHPAQFKNERHDMAGAMISFTQLFEIETITNEEGAALNSLKLEKQDLSGVEEPGHIIYDKSDIQTASDPY